MLDMHFERPSPWTVKEVAAACRICPTAASRKLLQFEQTLQQVLAALAGVSRSRPCDMAQMLTGLLLTGGRLAQLDRRRLERRIAELIQQPIASSQ